MPSLPYQFCSLIEPLPSVVLSNTTPCHVKRWKVILLQGGLTRVVEHDDDIVEGDVDVC